MADGRVEQGHDVLLSCARIVIERHKALSGRYEPTPCYEWRIGRYLLGDQQSKPPFCAIWYTESTAPTCQGQRSYETVAVTVLETALDPGPAAGDTTSSSLQ